MFSPKLLGENPCSPHPILTRYGADNIKGNYPEVPKWGKYEDPELRHSVTKYSTSNSGRVLHALPLKPTRKDNDMSMDDLIEQFIADIDFDAIKHWCAVFGIDYNEPPLDDMYPDWEGEIRQEIGDAIAKVGVK